MDGATQRMLHAKSLLFGKIFKISYWALGKDHPVTESMLERYCSSRRELPGGVNQAGHSTRYGATEAYHSTQDGPGLAKVDYGKDDD